MPGATSGWRFASPSARIHGDRDPLLTESLVLAAAGGFVGLVLGRLMIVVVTGSRYSAEPARAAF
jgi:hypothetical protein